MSSATLRELIGAARTLLGIDHLMLTVHDASFPAGAGEDVGRGSPYSRASAELMRFLGGLGFDSLQLGPQGKTTKGDASPYNGALFARSHQSLDLASLLADPVTCDLVDAAQLERAVAGRPEDASQRAAHGYSWEVLDTACRSAYQRFAARPAAFGALAAELQGFAKAHAGWLVPDGLYEALIEVHGCDHFSQFAREPGGEIDARLYRAAADQQAAAQQRRHALLSAHTATLNRNTFVQALLQRQHAQLRQLAHGQGIRLWADFQVGYAARDLWRWGSAFLDGYCMGAPPSRTNPEGQPWGYPVLDPSQLRAGATAAGPATELLRRRVRRLLADFDGLRIDHPHGLVCPWVYRSDDPDPGRAVRAGARLRSSPASEDHPELARFAIARETDLAPATRNSAPYSDAWVSRLDDAQVGRYAELFDLILDEMANNGRSHADLAAEVLSTCPYPLARVLERHRLGRFRVVQKANPEDPADPYRSESAQAADWIMLGTHDTASVWSVVDGWVGGSTVAPWTRYLADRLAPRAETRAALATRLHADPRALTHALFADLFLGPARHVCLFFPDLFGLRERYNTPGTFGDHNWRLRVPHDFAERYARDRASGAALDLPAALTLALEARSAGAAGEAADLARALRPHASAAALGDGS